MKFTSKEFMEWLGLKVGDRVEIKDDEDIDNKIFDIKQTKKNIYLVNEKYYFEISFLLDINFNILHAPKRVGDLKCSNEIKCEQCPLRGVCTTMMAFPPMKLYDILNRYGVHKNTYFDQEIYDILRARLDKEVE